MFTFAFSNLFLIIKMFENRIRIATRGSDLALWQAHHLKIELKNLGFESELKIIVTKGDAIQDLSFDKIEGKGFFTKEVEEALLSGEADVAVHSMKDLPTEPQEGLLLAGVSYREDPRDCLLISDAGRDENRVLKLKKEATVGTSSARRKAQIKYLRDDIIIKDIRGNVPTRIKKLREGQFDAILLAKAGLDRLKIDISDLLVIPLHHREFVPAPAQGVLAYQCKVDDIKMRKILANIHHANVADCTNVERKVLSLMEGGCHLPLGVYCEKDAMGYYHAFAAMSEALDRPLIKVQLSQSTTYQLAENLYTKIKSELKNSINVSNI
jgi:hydroxymethylbilane synthase